MLRAVYEVWCDGEDCSEWYQDVSGNAVLRSAGYRGWTRVTRPVRDYCAACSRRRAAEKAR